MENASTPIVNTRQGSVMGCREEGIDVWRGIPFAAPPTGDLRWRAPQPVECWQGVRDATRFSASSWQNKEFCRPIPVPSRRIASISTSGHPVHLRKKNR